MPLQDWNTSQPPTATCASTTQQATIRHPTSLQTAKLRAQPLFSQSMIPSFRLPPPTMAYTSHRHHSRAPSTSMESDSGWVRSHFQEASKEQDKAHMTSRVPPKSTSRIYSVLLENTTMMIKLLLLTLLCMGPSTGDDQAPSFSNNLQFKRKATYMIDLFLESLGAIYSREM